MKFIDNQILLSLEPKTFPFWKTSGSFAVCLFFSLEQKDMAISTGKWPEVNHIREEKREMLGPQGKRTSPHSWGLQLRQKEPHPPLLRAEGGDFRERTKRVWGWLLLTCCLGLCWGPSLVVGLHRDYIFIFYSNVLVFAKKKKKLIKWCW